MQDNEISEHLLKLASDIKDTSSRCLILSEKSEAMRSQVKEIAASWNIKVAANPALKNELQRKTELDSLLKSDVSYYAAEEESKNVAYQLAVARIDLEYLNNVFRAYLAIAGMQATLKV